MFEVFEPACKLLIVHLLPLLQIVNISDIPGYIDRV